MAKASVTTRKVSVTVEKEIEEIHLVLSRSQAESLGALTGIVGGCSFSSRRKHIDQIRKALSDAGVTFPKANFMHGSDSVYFAFEEDFDK